MNPKQILNSFFNLQEFRPGQEEIINTILTNENVLAILPTGGGKSLCYQIPSLLSKTFSIVISPLIALMKDQVDSLNEKENIAAFINSSLDYKASEKVLNEISTGKIKILYISPEKLTNLSFIHRLKIMTPSYLFVDEAHCISEWGHNFRPSYRKIKDFLAQLEINNVSAFTATATEEVRKDIVKQLNLINPKIFVRGFERSNLKLAVICTKQKKEYCVSILKNESGSSIIYTATRKLSEEISEHLRLNKINSTYYHAGLTSELRRIIQDDFINDRVKTIVATNAFGMGIDKSNIRTIIHCNLTGSLENYYQEIGRAGRDGKESNAILLYEEKDKLIQNYFIACNNPTRQHIQEVYDTLCNSVNLSLGMIPDTPVELNSNFYSLLDKKEINNVLTESCLRVLEESGYISQTQFTFNYNVQFLLEPNELHSHLKNISHNEVKDLIVLIVRDYGSRVFKVPTSINLNKICENLELQIQDVISLLKYLSQSGIILLHLPSTNPLVRITKNRIKSIELQLNISHMESLKEYSMSKLEKMIDYTFTNECRFKFILNYFGQKTDNYKCGKCDICLGKKILGIDGQEYLEEVILQTIHEAKIPLRIKTAVQILTGKANLASLRRFSTFESCIHFKKNDIEQAIFNLINKKQVLISNNVLSLSDKGIEQFAFENEIAIDNTQNAGYENDLRLFNQLRQIRKEAADRFNQTSNLICTDELLRTIVKIKPKTYSEFINIAGCTERMFNKIGELFLNAIINFNKAALDSNKLKQKKFTKDFVDILALVKKKYSLEDISAITKLPESILSTQIETLIEAIPDLEIDHMFEKNELKTIFEKIDNGYKGLKELRAALHGKISYARLRIASAKKRVS
jgi:ATP-dependent DNA helicase RecQ